ncbi:MAG: hypothetical protein A3D24_00525 [Candidatus Blackburnbacteria bacterium RIFCSPHIGHO2_02_FULL_39_13]|uniref:Uncharacterized protein n=1 Tax=Candidatus Blackburnbacteria bacterium RIFCSPLOWO2_01_FULL_40_20 TaxID=1797519 RepID=A0A1G1VG17_9BACT|nr:MAG: hypothetical protein UT38_C0003G0022 [Microgenomates group bacterium GW2011_GWA2_39_19]OGY07560.1 MAG: hypothetical protein A2694_04875 [Candidatus Blackburnbacteria bacterium RIFCSPHIGHO2_01_FULL_40_17]OGY08643.1 MAG: hypothetical protein A3D24_00525 [Candidatus Blackburnbacteria bacterium RIFCSPHIGHO2_02_FULL_39_13]OGY14277.1 MAG: hypothetical protein A3A77_02270 [Candidatus Blackburnbacteria bacterium RIFCSPLOWO2_01_FULL_40_20]OGY14604.1 MAG: hypothetical protein A3I52_00480 [Candida
MQFIKKHFVIISLAFVASILVAIKILVPAPTTVSSTPSPIPKAQSWNGVVPGQTTIQNLPESIGKSEATLNQNGQTTYEVERKGGGPPHEVITQNNTVELVKDRVLSGNISTFKNNYGEPEGEYFGEHQSVGFKTYVWAKDGVAVVAHEKEGVIFEVWYFQPTTLQVFLSTWGKGLSIEPEQKSGY